MKFSIITPSFNQGEYIEECVLSVLNQSYENFEHIVIDGGSADNTIEVLKKYSHLKWVSEPDEGVSDALNKALARCEGDVIGWLNCDDYYLPETFSHVVSVFKKSNARWVIGNSKKLYQKTMTVVERPFVEVNSKTLSRNCDLIRTNAAFYKKDLIDQVGLFDVNLKMVMDYDLFVRLSKLCEPKNIDKHYHVFRVHPDQITTYKNSITQYKELSRIFIREGFVFALLRKTVVLTRSFVKRKVKLLLIRFGFINPKYSNIPFSTRSHEINQ
jgi:glycosyltransferase involved in cell wall biosynthesis